MLTASSSISSFGEAQDEHSGIIRQASTACASTTVAGSFMDSGGSISPSLDTSDDLYVQLDRANGRRLDHQCAQLRLRQQQTAELGDILLHADRLNAQRLSNQDYTPATVRRIESLERVSERLNRLTDSRQTQRARLSSQQQAREEFLINIAERLSHMDEIVDAECHEIGAGFSEQHVEHPREHMRRSLLRSIDRLHRLESPILNSDQSLHFHSLTG
ncbi:hypothetical protein COEREDRAFT_79818 [Coemansia reversa NRRL 1564]|uniref:Uncharacterized protein n=1 Tax=Coemansia reversa (strain ATCC 12441 / NRRL 1564) TaxID=763665 RepID=A0A2G5BH33_COERN|nr:hypothetical protein COEREDRAFT_79818 [Coemansia reversa NRRL 1564]|eukprot:PIA18329.1 hypothetical protein COEREDRAFT_79818 [Coemansia reversa NRRL 1564]